eukprot:TRINITY_DN3581_c0_g3_i2.p1 TRINITY_DN3581_c0_g3~~TRINITY_DN3581_c0_g3_i2.p1  ORF type:complete len:327 (-),score=40.97 TRINITY_DN3581_c0_g3_i2:411-1391(-)
MKAQQTSFVILFLQASVLGQSKIDVGAISQEIDCTETLNGCTCEFVWMHSGLEYKGCQNPDKDPDGPWCMVDLDQCKNGATIDLVKSQVIRDAEVRAGGQDRNWDRCKVGCELGSGFPGELDVCISGNQSLFGCSCKEEWTLTLDGLTKVVEYCENPDNDPGGNWCKIDPNMPCDLGLLTDLDQVISNSDTLEVQDYWDYCITDCGGLVRKEILLSVLAPVSQASTSAISSVGNFGVDDITSASSSPLSAVGANTDSTTTPTTGDLGFIGTTNTTNNGNGVIVSNPKISNEQGVAQENSSVQTESPVPAPSSSAAQSSGGFFGGDR